MLLSAKQIVFGLFVPILRFQWFSYFITTTFNISANAKAFPIPLYRYPSLGLFRLNLHPHYSGKLTPDLLVSRTGFQQEKRWRSHLGPIIFLALKVGTNFVDKVSHTLYGYSQRWKLESNEWRKKCVFFPIKLMRSYDIQIDAPIFVGGTIQFESG